MSFVLAALVAADATTADVVGIGVDDLVLFHPDPPLGLGRLSCGSL
jgi:hypothetical protein